MSEQIKALRVAAELREYAQLLEPQLSLRRLLFEAIHALEDLTAISEPVAQPVARLFHRVDGASPWTVPETIARTYEEFPDESAKDNPYWKEGAKLYAHAEPKGKP